MAYFTHGDFGWNVNPRVGIVEWDGDGDEPSDDDVDAASDYWDTTGYWDYESERADEIGDYKYEQWRESRWED